jgi:YidC/Oxa1 family membrane protein insertase
MKSEQRMLLAVAASILIFYVWSSYFAPPPQVPSQPVPTSAQEVLPPKVVDSIASAATRTPTDAIVDPQQDIAEKTVTLTNALSDITFTNDGGYPTSWQLHAYQEGAGKELQAVNMITAPNLEALAIRLDGLGTLFPERPRYQMRQIGNGTVQFVWRSKDLDVTKTFMVSDKNYVTNVTVEVRNKTNAPLQGRVGLEWEAENPAGVEAGGFMTMLKGPQNIWHPLYYLNGSLERIENLDNVATDGGHDGVFWAGLENRYFLAAILPREVSTQTRFRVARVLETAEHGTQVVSGLATAPMVIPTGGSIKQEFTIYVGPKEIEALKAVGSSLEAAIDYGFFGIVALPMLYLLKFFYAIISNYGIAIILLTLFIKLLLHPITKASMQSMRRMQKVQPQLKAIREKFKEDKQRLNMEMMQLFKTHKVNPMGGCLPMVLQIPVYIALYQVLWNSIELYRAPFFWFYTDLSAPDPFYITPVLLGVAFFLQQKLTPSPTADPAQQKMMMMMPIMFTGFMFFLPSGLVIYILINTLYSVLQQWLMNRGLGLRDLFKGNLTPKAV